MSAVEGTKSVMSDCLCLCALVLSQLNCLTYGPKMILKFGTLVYHDNTLNEFDGQCRQVENLIFGDSDSLICVLPLCHDIECHLMSCCDVTLLHMVSWCDITLQCVRLLKIDCVFCINALVQFSRLRTLIFLQNCAISLNVLCFRRF